MFEEVLEYSDDPLEKLKNKIEKKIENKDEIISFAVRGLGKIMLIAFVTGIASAIGSAIGVGFLKITTGKIDKIRKAINILLF